MKSQLTNPPIILAPAWKQSGASPFATILLFAIIFVIGTGPRIGLMAIDAEIRIQDLIILPTIVYLLLSPMPVPRNPLQRLLGILLPITILAIVASTTLSSMILTDVSPLRRLLYFGRTLEMFILSSVVAGLYLRCRESALSIVLAAIGIGGLLNIAWVGFQVVTGEPQVLVGRDFGNMTESYGPKLLGEPSAFGVGQYWTFVASAGAAQLMARHRPVTGVLLFIAAAAGAWLAQSRVSFGGILLIGGFILILNRGSRTGLNFLGLLSGILLGGVGLFWFLASFGSRFTPDAILQGLDFRVQQIWRPFADQILANPLIGVGPGGITGEHHLSEAHNIALRAMLDFGMIAGTLFLMLFIVAIVCGIKLAANIEADSTTRLVGYMASFHLISILVSGIVQDSLTAVMPSHLAMVSLGVLAAQRVLWSDSEIDSHQVNSIEHIFPQTRKLL